MDLGAWLTACFGTTFWKLMLSTWLRSIGDPWMLIGDSKGPVPAGAIVDQFAGPTGMPFAELLLPDLYFQEAAV